jgi:chemotaxis protein MotB
LSHGGGHGGGGSDRWLVSYADMVTLLMAFFIVMYAMSQVDNAKYAAVKQSLNQVIGGGNQIIPMSGSGDGVSAPLPSESGAIPTALPEADPPKSMPEVKVDPLQGLGKALYADFVNDGRFTIWISERGLTISLMGSAAFDSGSAEIKPEFAPLLDVVAAKLSTIPNDISVEGFTDSDPIQTAEYPSNWYLSVSRANRVRDHLEQGGIEASRMIVVGYGETRPLLENKTPEGKAHNRRVDVVVLRSKVVIDRGQEIKAAKP